MKEEKAKFVIDVLLDIQKYIGGEITSYGRNTLEYKGQYVSYHDGNDSECIDVDLVAGDNTTLSFAYYFGGQSNEDCFVLVNSRNRYMNYYLLHEDFTSSEHYRNGNYFLAYYHAHDSWLSPDLKKICERRFKIEKIKRVIWE